jgi:hypothetical protein
MKTDLDNFRKLVLGLDLAKYRAILCEIEAIQKMFIEGDTSNQPEQDSNVIETAVES